jgi:catechol 2,3-dioxygenase-like lactoylglutathione lyase family enzyme
MVAKLDHTIVSSRDKHASARFIAHILGLGPPGSFGHFVTVEVGNGVSLDYDEAEHVHSQHYAFLVDDDEFEPIFQRVKAEGVVYYADPGHRHVNQINTRDGGRGFYFSDPDGHNMEVLTRRYGSGG